MRRQYWSMMRVAVAALCLLVTAVPAGALQSGDFTYELNPGDTTVAITKYTGSGGDVDIPVKLDNLPVTVIGDNAFSWCSGLTGVTIPIGVTGIGVHAFSYSGLTSVAIPDSVTTLGYAAFFYCSNLTQVEIGKGVTSIGWAAFEYCGSLTAITVDTGNSVYGSENGVVFDKSLTTLLLCPAGTAGTYVVPNGVTTIGSSAFASCAGLTNVTLSASVASIENGAFNNCTGLTGITFSNGVANIGDGAFSFCSSLSGITISDSVAGIGDNAFSFCSSLTRVVVGNGVARIGGYAFMGCSSLTGVYFKGNAPVEGDEMFFFANPATVYYLQGTTGWGPTFGGRPVMPYPYVFTTSNGAVTITGYVGPGGSVSIPDTIFDLPVTCIGEGAFSGRSSLTNVTVSGGVTNIAPSAFSGCSALTVIAVDAANTSYRSIDGVLFDSGMATLLQYPGGLSGSYAIPGGVTRIGDSAFRGCAKLTGITLPDSVASIGASAFRNCSKLPSVAIPAGVAVVGELAFAGCTVMTAINVNGANTSYSSAEGVLFDKGLATLLQCPGGREGDYEVPVTVTAIGASAFAGCSGLTDIALPGGVTAIGGSAFAGCTGLTGIALPSGITAIGDAAFAGCSGLTGIAFPDGVTRIGDFTFMECTGLTGIALPGTVTAIGASAFAGCTGLTGIALPGTVTAIGASAFAGCTGLTGVALPDGVAFIGQQAFSSCHGLTRVIFGDSITGVGASAFYGCSSLDSVTLPGSVTNIGDSVFFNCQSLRSVFFKGDAPGAGANAFAFTPANIYYPPEASGWGETFAGRPATPMPFTYSVDGSALTITGYTGTRGDINVPSDINGFPVTGIGDRAFENCGRLTRVTLPGSVTNIGYRAFYGCLGLTSVTLGRGVSVIGAEAFYGCGGLASVCFTGNVPVGVGADPFRNVVNATVYYLPDTLGWESAFAGRPALLWNPQVQGGAGFGLQSKYFGFTIAGTPDILVVVEACTNLATPVWAPVATNTLSGGASAFSDSQWTNFPARFYRLSTP